MSNPGVIKLARENIGKHRIWFDDNIGESIHLHIDEWRFDFTIRDFLKFCEELENIINSMVDLTEFNVNKWDNRFIHQLSHYLLKMKEIKLEKVRLSSLTVIDDNGMKIRLIDSDRVKALKRQININDTIHRKSNFLHETNESRLMKCLHFVKKYGYPVDENYIVITEKNHLVLDGWHRGACMYYLNGDIDVVVKKIYFDDNFTNIDSFHFPRYLMKEGSRIVIYGAGGVGKAYYNQVKKSNYCIIVKWVDKNYKSLNYIQDEKIEDPNCIDKIEYDFIVIANSNPMVREEIYTTLLSKGVKNEKIIM